MPFQALELRYTADKLKPLGSRSWVQVRKAENFYTGQLRKVARVIGEITQTLMPDESDAGDDPFAQENARRRMNDRSRILTEALDAYARRLEPWARTTAEKMMLEVAQRDKRAWMEHSDLMGRALRREIETTPTGQVFRQLLDYEVDLITSLPRDAAARVHDLTVEGLIKGTRAKDISDAIMRTGHVSRSRADLIGRTEVGRTSSKILQARAESIGSTGYIWRTSRDKAVRPSHRAMEGVFVPWNKPPTLDGMVGHAACLPNCRCHSEVVLPQTIFDRYRRVGRR